MEGDLGRDIFSGLKRTFADSARLYDVLFSLPISAMHG